MFKIHRYIERLGYIKGLLWKAAEKMQEALKAFIDTQPVLQDDIFLLVFERIT